MATQHDAPISFQRDVLPLFRPKDMLCMGAHGVDLNEYAYMSSAGGDATFGDHANARHVLARLAGAEAPRMPPGGPYWSEANLALFRGWIDAGCQP